MTATLTLERWLDVVDKSYLAEFIAGGGSSVKFAVCYSDVDPTRVRDSIIERARTRGYLTAEVDAAQTKLHMIEQLFGRIAEQIPWNELTTRRLCQFAVENHWTLPDPIDPGRGLVAQLDEVNRLGEAQISMELQRRIGDILNDKALAKDFRVAMTWLARARLEAGPESEKRFENIVEWLTARLRLISPMKSYQIFTKINRANARFLFGSLLLWLRKAGYPGLVTVIDARRLVDPMRATDGTVNYTRGSLLDAYEVFRQFIDATDEFDGSLLVILVSPEFLNLETRGRGIGLYPALMYRVYDEVRDRHLANPFTALVRIGTGASADQNRVAEVIG